MAIAYFTIPETGKIIYNGDTVILSEYPDTIAAVAYGWYKYEENAMNGWHFILLPSKSIIPAANVNLSLLTVVPNSSDDDRNPIPLNTSLQDIESRAFITLDSIAQRDKLIPEFMPNGRIVRVNDSVNHTTNYYEWNIETQSWDDWHLDGVIDDYMLLSHLNPTDDEIESFPTGQLYSDTTNHKGVIKGIQEFYDSEYINEHFYTKADINSIIGDIESLLSEV